MWETLLPNLVHITGIPLSEILFIGDQAPRNNLEPESYTQYSMLNSNIISIK